MQLSCPVSLGEVLDKISILRIKQQRIKDLAKLQHVTNELDALTRLIDKPAEFEPFLRELAEHNTVIWDVEDALRRNSVDILLHASNGAPDGIRKLDGIARQNAEFGENTRLLPIITVLSCDELDLALGRSNVIHAAVLTGPAGKTFLSRSQTLVQYRMADDDGDANAKASTKRDLPATAPLTANSTDDETVRTRTTQQD